MTFPYRPTRAACAALLLLLTAAVPLGGCSDDDDDGAPGPGPGTPSAEFVIQPGAFNAGDMAFVPSRDTVQVGQVVRLRNGDTITHSISTQTAGGPSWGAITAGGTRDATASQAGSFTFICTIGGHTMSGVLVVLP
jgi:plastocyanin